MISVESIGEKIQMLPPAVQKRVLDYIDDLLEKPNQLSPKERADAWEAWVKSHSDNMAIVDDSREAIYED
jgi:hypothetical protein